MGQPLRVPISGQQAAVDLSIWLDDGSRASLSAPGGVLVSAGVLLLTPQHLGTFGLHASARDANGCVDQTGLSRIVTVTP